MKDRPRGLNLTRYEEECFSMLDITITFNASDREEIPENIMYCIRRVLYEKIKESEYYKDGWFSNYMARIKAGEISFDLTPAISEKEALRYVQMLFLGFLGVSLKKEKVIEILGEEKLPKMEAELEEAKKEIWALLGDITMGGMIRFETVRS